MSDGNAARRARLSESLRRVVLLRETGPKSAAWHRARAHTIWRLHELIAHEASEPAGPGEGRPPPKNPPL
jgi:hypothetical protein